MNTFEMTLKDSPDTVMGISTTLLGSMLEDGFTPMGADNAGLIGRILTAIDEHMYPLSHEDAEKKESFLQIVPCIMVQGFPHKKILTMTTCHPEYDEDYTAICAHGHIVPGETLLSAIDAILMRQMKPFAGLSFVKKFVGFLQTGKPGKFDNHLQLLYLYRAVDLRGTDSKHEGTRLDWLDAEVIQRLYQRHKLEPWSNRVCEPLLLHVANTSADISVRGLNITGGSATVMDRELEEDDSMSKKTMLGVEPGLPVVTNLRGGRQSHSPNAFHLLPANAMFAAARVAKEGADKYDETIHERNYTKIAPEEHANHCIQHQYAYLAGDDSDDHLGHAIVRALFTYECAHLDE